jgi:hypothetical protein
MLLFRRNRPLHPGPERLNDVLFEIVGAAKHDVTIILISDFDGADTRTESLLLNLSQHNDVVAFFVYDPLEMNLPRFGEMVVSNGNLQLELQFRSESMRKRLLSASSQRFERVLSLQKKLDLPVLAISCGEDVPSQLHRALNTGARAKKSA